MSLDLNFPAGPIVLDASVIINALGSGRAQDIFRALAVPCYVEERTIAEITRHPIAGMSHVPDLTALTANCLQIHRMNSAEYAVYLRLVSGSTSNTLGAGESAAIACAHGQNLAVILDDAKARRIRTEQFPRVPTASSLSLFVEAGRRAGWADDQLWQLVQDARTNARMSVIKGEESIMLKIAGSQASL